MTSKARDEILLHISGTPGLWLDIETVGKANFLAFVLIAMMSGYLQSGSYHRDSMDKAKVRVEFFTSQKYQLLFQSTECEGCPYWLLKDEIKNGSDYVVNATFAQELRVMTGTSKVCDVTYKFGENGEYLLTIPLKGNSCHISTIKYPDPSFLPVLVAFFVLFVIPVFTLVVKGIVKRLNLPEDEQLLLEQPEVEGKKRVRSLDCLRGLSIVVMIFVNYGGGGYWFFAHSRWNGLTVADLVFPWFMWMMGVSTVISIRSRLSKGVRRKKILLDILQRSVKLFLLGLAINSVGKNDITQLRIGGVLQRFSIAYAFVATLETFLMLEPNFEAVEMPCGLLGFEDIAIFQWIIVMVVVAIHTLVIFLLPVPGCETGYLGPGGLHDGGQHANCTGGATGYIDRTVFGPNHIYTHPTCKTIYNGDVAFDPEGILGCLTSIFSVYLGVQAGRTLLTFPDKWDKIKRWLLWGSVCGLFAGALCGFSKEGGVIPVNKNLWSLSFVLSTACFAFFLLTAFYMAIDVHNFWSGAPLTYAGMNSILLYCGHETLSGMLPFSWKPFTKGHPEALFMDVWGAGLWVLIAYWLFRRKWFLAL